MSRTPPLTGSDRVEAPLGSTGAHRGAPPRDCIRVRGARQNNLANIDVDIPLGAIVAITGVSGSGKSSLAFDTLYAEGQRRYVESFSPYARQFMDRMDRPDVDDVEGVLPAVAIDQKNAIRASRSTVGTITELNDFLKVLYARAATLHCGSCGQPVAADSPHHAAARLVEAFAGRRAVVSFRLAVTGEREAAAALEWAQARGFLRVWQHYRAVPVGEVEPSAVAVGIDVVADRVALDLQHVPRVAEAIASAYTHGHGRATAWVEGEYNSQDGWNLILLSEAARHCAKCDAEYPVPLPNHFSYNSPLGACSQCNGFGAIIDVDLDLVIPNRHLSLAGGAIRPWTTESTVEERRALQELCTSRSIPLDVPWEALEDAQRRLVIDGDPSSGWYGVRGWFRWQEGRTYKMHVRVLLSRYRAYVPCPECTGARFRPHALLYRLGSLTLADLNALPLTALRAFFDALALGPEAAGVGAALLGEIHSRLRFLDEVGVGYLTLGRQSRTLSGGEVQRVNLTTAIGSALVNTLYVLDEPSIGLHARDNDRLMGILERLRANRNTIVVVEHDDAIIRRVDHIIDMGPGPGKHGGRVVFQGPPRDLATAMEHSPTARFLAQADSRWPRRPRRPWGGSPALRVRNAREHNLRGIDVDIPLERFVAITGVSGSGKSTLIEDIVYRGLLRQRGIATDRAGAHDALELDCPLADVVLVDQSPVGTTPRSNPATYVKAFDGIRRIFAETERARALGLSAGSFSFNSEGGRCEACDGVGYERIEMQFLSDQYVTCDKCQGRRYRDDILRVSWRGMSIDQVLLLTVDESARVFDDEADILVGLGALQRVGLGYLRLGQPLNTLSGGESQRLKLASHLGLARSRGTLFLFDEPTTGLHLSDVQQLLSNLHDLVDAGNSVVAIEHHLDLVAAADWVIDLGPEGGAEGGIIVAAGPPEHIADHPTSHTGRYLRDHVQGPRVLAEVQAPRRYLAPVDICVRGARVHNLKDVSVRIPRDALVVITGPSGSGKSSLAFDVLFAEGQRRFVDCLSPYARQYVQQVTRPDVDELLGIPPTVCISQRTSRAGRKSTVATITEIFHYLRLIWARTGVQHCVTCGSRVSGLGARDIALRIAQTYDGREVHVLAPAVRGRKGWHKDVFKRAAAEGHTYVRVDGALWALREVPSLERYQEHDIEYVVATWRVNAERVDTVERYVARALELGLGTAYVLPVGNKRLRAYSTERMCIDCNVGYDPPDPRLFSFNTSAGACRTCGGSGMVSPEGAEEGTADDASCGACGGSRLSALARSVRVGGLSIAEATRKTPAELMAWLDALALGPREAAIAAAPLAEARSRCRFLLDVGLEYLTLDRGAHTLSGGEAQRVRLASQLSAHLRGVLYVLDEPTIGLHPVDNDRLLTSLRALVDAGNSVVVVEHDDETIRRSDALIELGPHGGQQGGTIVEQGPTREVLSRNTCATARALHAGGRGRAQFRDRAADRSRPAVRIRGATHHNLDHVDVDIPLGCLTVVTGVSGSGKSSLVRDVLGGGLQALRSGGVPAFGVISGAEGFKVVREIDQSPIGKTPASTPSTYIGLHDWLRKLFAQLPDARARGYTASRFSFNTKGGRCEHCKGQGQVRHEMSFLPDVFTPCEVCEGKRFDEETLAIRYRGLSIADVLELTVDEARDVFSAHRHIARALHLLRETGLGYLQLGQPSHTLSGGEAQRIKLVEELQKEGGRGALYIMDEPSTGLHMDDLQKLIAVVQSLVDRGDTVVLIEHNLDVIASADWLVDMGPDGGRFGGQVVAQGPRDEVMTHPTSYTARFLRYHSELNV